MKKNFVLLIFIYFILSIVQVNALSSESIYNKINYYDTDESKSISVGDMVEIGTEKFHIISIDNDTVRALAQYNLDVGFDSVNSEKFEKENPTGIQDINDKGSSGYKNIGTGNGTVEYASSKVNYDGSTVKIYVDNYVNYLTQNYNVDISGDLITREELTNFGCEWSYGNTCIDSQYKWLYTTSYWIKSDLTYQNSAYYVTYDGFFNRIDVISLAGYVDVYFGVRPVIVFDKKYIDKYTVTFKDYDGKIINQQEVDYNSNAIEPIIPSRLGYTFDGWDKKYSNVTDNLDIIATYKPNKYTVNFNTMGGESVGSQLITFGDKVLEPEIPNYPEYKFIGWYTEKDYSKKFDFDTIISDNITLYAKWNIDFDNYSYTEKKGDKQIFENNSILSYSYSIDAPFLLFDHIEIDNLDLKKEIDYTVTEGSTIISFTLSGINKLNSLKKGKYSVKSVYTNNQIVNAFFEINDSQQNSSNLNNKPDNNNNNNNNNLTNNTDSNQNNKPNNKPNNESNYEENNKYNDDVAINNNYEQTSSDIKNPHTFDNIVKWIILAFISFILLCLSILYKKKCEL